MTHVTCRLTAKNRDQLRNPTLGNRVWTTLFSLQQHELDSAEWIAVDVVGCCRSTVNAETGKVQQRLQFDAADIADFERRLNESV